MSESIRVFITMAIIFIILNVSNRFIAKNFKNEKIQRNITEDITKVDIKHLKLSQISDKDLNVFINNETGDIVKIESTILKEKVNKEDNFKIMSINDESKVSSINTQFSSKNDDLNQNIHSNWSIIDQNDKSIVLSNQLSANLKQEKHISITDKSVVLIQSKIINTSSEDVKVNLNSNITYNGDGNSDVILHKGLVGYLNNKIQEKKLTSLASLKTPIKTTGNSWFGYTDKYILIAMSADYSLQISGIKKGKNQFSIISNSDDIELKANASKSVKSYMYSGVKDIDILDKYKYKYNLKNFDLSVDFGTFYFITRPLLNLFIFLSTLFNNFILAILLLSLLIKLYFLSSEIKKYKNAQKIKVLQPKIDLINKKHENNSMLKYQELNNLYKKEKVNPGSGLLASLTQGILSFAFYKVIQVYVGLRHANFLWIADLSSQDTSSIFNLFGLIQYTLPAFLQIGLLSVLYAILVFIQMNFMGDQLMKSDMFKNIKYIMPIFIMFALKAFPSVLLIYWIFNSSLSLLQNLIFKKVIK